VTVLRPYPDSTGTVLRQYCDSIVTVSRQYRDTTETVNTHYESHHSVDTVPVVIAGVGASACVVRHFSCVPIQAEELKAPVIIASSLCLLHTVQVGMTSRKAVLEGESICGADDDEDEKDVSGLVHLKLHLEGGLQMHHSPNQPRRQSCSFFLFCSERIEKLVTCQPFEMGNCIQTPTAVAPG